MLREHAWSYIGLAVVLVASSALVGSSLVLRAAARLQHANMEGLSPNEAAKHAVLISSGRDASTFIVVLSGLVAVFLVAQTMNFVVDGRRRELALLRLAGASPLRVTTMVVGESFILGLGCSIIGAAISLALVNPYAVLLSQQNNWLPGFPVHVHVGALGWCVIIMTAVTMIGAFAAARRIGRIPPVEAVRAIEQNRRLMSFGRWLLAGIGAATVIVFLLIPAHAMDYKVSTAAVGAGAVLVVSALAPLVVPAIARGLGGLLTLIAPGAGLVAREHTAHAARRTSSFATPIVIVLGLGAVFGMLAQTGRAESMFGLEELKNTHAVVDLPAADAAPPAFDEANRLSEVGALTRVERVEDWSWAKSGHPSDDFLQLMGVESGTVTEFVPFNFIHGSIDDISGTDVAVISGAAEIGDSLRLQKPNGSSLSVHVVATVESTSFIYGTFLVDEKVLDENAGTNDETWLVGSAQGTTDDQLLNALEGTVPPTTVTARAAWIDQSTSRTVANQRSSILTIIGSAAVLALFSLAQSTLTSIRERRGELALLQRIGAPRRSAIATVLIESLITFTTAAVLAVGVITLVHERMRTALAVVSPELSPIVPVSTLLLVLIACFVTSIASAVIGALTVVRRS